MAITTSGLKDLITSYSQAQNSIILQLNAEKLHTDARISKQLTSFFKHQGILVEAELCGLMLCSVGEQSRNKLLQILQVQGILPSVNRCPDGKEDHSSEGSISDGEDQDEFFSWGCGEERSQAGSCPESHASHKELSGHGNRPKAFTWAP